jgi:hypothetical protein
MGRAVVAKARMRALERALRQVRLSRIGGGIP